MQAMAQLLTAGFNHYLRLKPVFFPSCHRAESVEMRWPSECEFKNVIDPNYAELLFKEVPMQMVHYAFTNCLENRLDFLKSVRRWLLLWSSHDLQLYLTLTGQTTFKSYIQALGLEDLKFRLQGASEYHVVINLSASQNLSWLRAAGALWQGVILNFIDLTAILPRPSHLTAVS